MFTGRTTRRTFLAATPTALSCSRSSATNIRFGAVSPGSMFQLPVIAAQELGYFGQAGITLELQEMAGGARALQALLGGSVDVISSLFDQLVTLAAENRGLRSFLLIQRCPIQVLAVSPKSRRSIHTIADLKGTMVAVTSPGSAMHLQLKFWAKRSGIEPDDFSVVGIASNAARAAALESGKVDAAVLGDPGASVLEERYPNLVVLADTRTPDGTQRAFGTGFYPGGVLIARDEWLRDHSHQARALTAAVLKASQWISDSPAEQVMRTVPRQYRLEDSRIYQSSVKRLIPALSKDGLMPPQGPEIVKTVLSTYDKKLRQANVDVRRTFTNEYVAGL